jgi:hypothetical protein
MPCTTWWTPICASSAVCWVAELCIIKINLTAINELLKIGSPPDWEIVPDEFKVDLALLASFRR